MSYFLSPDNVKPWICPEMFCIQDVVRKRNIPVRRLIHYHLSLVNFQWYLNLSMSRSLFCNSTFQIGNCVLQIPIWWSFSSNNACNFSKSEAIFGSPMLFVSAARSIFCSGVESFRNLIKQTSKHTPPTVLHVISPFFNEISSTLVPEIRRQKKSWRLQGVFWSGLPEHLSNMSNNFDNFTVIHRLFFVSLIFMEKVFNA